MMVFNKYAFYKERKEAGGVYMELLNFPKSAHLRKVGETGKVQKPGAVVMSISVWESGCTTKEYHLMWNAKKARVRKKYRNRIERRI